MRYDELLMGMAVGLTVGMFVGLFLSFAAFRSLKVEKPTQDTYSCSSTDAACIRSHMPEPPRFGPTVDYNGEPIGLFDRKLGKVYFFDEKKSSASSR